MNPALTDLLSPATLARIDSYALLSRVAVDGFLSGMHRSLSHGTGGEFLQYRNYTPGDDLKYVDWKVYSRQDRFHTKVFREETSMNLRLVLDASASLDYQGTRAPCGKWRYACMVAACLAYLASRQGDNVGLYLYSGEARQVVEPGMRHDQLTRIFATLARHRPGGAADHEPAWTHLARHFRSRGMVVVISDFLEAEETLPRLLRNLRFARQECLAFQVLDPDETDLPFAGSTEFIDAESGGRILTFPDNVRKEYQEKMTAFLETLDQTFRRAQVDFLRLGTTDSLARALANYLHKRDAQR